MQQFIIDINVFNLDISIKKLLKFPPPIFIISISIAQFALFIYNLVDCDNNMDLVQNKVFSGVLIFNPHKKNEVWRLITHLFVYTGLVFVFFLFYMLLLISIFLLHFIKERFISSKTSYFKLSLALYLNYSII